MNKPTDFNDMAKLQGAEAVRRAVDAAKPVDDGNSRGANAEQQRALTSRLLSRTGAYPIYKPCRYVGSGGDASAAARCPC